MKIGMTEEELLSAFAEAVNDFLLDVKELSENPFITGGWRVASSENRCQTLLFQVRKLLRKNNTKDFFKFFIEKVNELVEKQHLGEFRIKFNEEKGIIILCTKTGKQLLILGWLEDSK